MTAATRRTLAAATTVRGSGLHTGRPCSVGLLPAQSGSGIVFRRTDVPQAAPVQALPEHVDGTDRGIALGPREHAVRTVEHLLAVVTALGLDDLLVEVDGPEIPAGDGSAAALFEAVRAAGTVEQPGQPTVWRLAAPLTVREGDAQYVLAPAPALRVTVTVEWPHPSIGRQSGCYDATAAAFGEALARARTFGFVAEREALRARGLALGASPENTILLTESGLAHGTSLRWPDEFVRHKAVDLLGDLALAGGRIEADVTAFRPSHAGNVAVARVLRRVANPAAPPVIGIEQILGTLPHRYPMLLVDRVIEVQGRERIVGIKNVTFNEPFFQGHFPGHPVMPGVLIIEALAQTGGMLLMGSVDDPESKVVYFMSLDNVKFRRPVIPGDQLRFELEVLQFRGRNCRMRGVAYVDGQPAAEAEMAARLIDR
jgi:UDP-3-O-[3-hydroxymyristoyl] N-acetylglucosamine deacetylase/3-hydroxyacyl-[acyl-carrier-protein] dehydratase